MLRRDWTAPENRSAHKGLLPTNEIVSHKKTFAFSPPPLPNRRARRDNEPTSHKSTSLSIYIRKLGRRRKKRCTCTEATFGQRKCFGNLLLSNNADPIKPLTRNEAPLTIKKKIETPRFASSTEQLIENFHHPATFVVESRVRTFRFLSQESRSFQQYSPATMSSSSSGRHLIIFK